MTEARRAIVTGATGLIGSSLEQELIQRGYEVVVFSRDPIAPRTKVPGAADTMIYGRRVLPEKALDPGYQFQIPTLESALRDLLSAEPVGKNVKTR